MAKRESQGLQIALILLVMLTVILCIATYFFWSQSQKFGKEVASLRESSAADKQAVSDKIGENQTFKRYLGQDPDAPISDVESAYAEDMLLYGQSVPEGERNYRNLPAHLLNVLQEKNSQIKELQESERKLKDDIDREKKDALAQIEEHKSGHEKADQDLQEQRIAFQKQIDDLTQKVDDIEKKHAASRNRLKKEKSELASQLATATSDLSNLRESHKLLDDKLRRLQLKTFEQPDGKITYVNQASQTVYLNLGRADKLQRQTTFSVYDVDEHNLARSQPKGSIEVTRIIGDHLAEARVLEDNYADPIISGDMVYSPLWQAGKPVHFALAGKLDANADGSDDTELIKNLISLNGGVIDAEVDAQGLRTGKINIETRYLVIGEKPSTRSNEQGAKAYSQLRSESESFGVTEMSLDRFLADMGYQSVGHTVLLGDRASETDFRTEKPRERSERFRPRKPPSRTTAKPRAE